jgi:prevent-host-death family protein
MSKKWQLHEAKNHLSEVVDLALAEGPQIVTRHGKEVAVVVSTADFERRRSGRGRRGTVVSFLRGLSFKGARLEFDRSKDIDRELEL